MKYLVKMNTLRYWTKAPLFVCSFFSVVCLVFVVSTLIKGEREGGGERG